MGAEIFSTSPHPLVHNVGAVRSRSVVSDSLQPRGLWPARLLCPWDSPGKSTAVGCPALLQGIFPTQGSNQGLLYCRQILYCLSHQGSPRILEWVACSFPGDLPNLRIELGSPALQILYQLSYQYTTYIYMYIYVSVSTVEF